MQGLWVVMPCRLANSSKRLECLQCLQFRGKTVQEESNSFEPLNPGDENTITLLSAEKFTGLNSGNLYFRVLC
jgi:hypothetical protein